MKILKHLCSMVLHWLLVLAIGFTLSACTTTVFHVFAFDMAWDNQDSEVLDYRYGSSTHWVGPQEGEFTDGRTFGFQNYSGEMPRPDSLYVKWRNLTTGKVYKDTVNLRARLPSDFDGKTIYFMIKDAQLYVYLISKEPRPPETALIGPQAYHKFKITKIYPDAITQ
jgi:hypothetical protein